MALDESELIAAVCQHVDHDPSPRGPGDDAAQVGELVLATDTMVEGTHFLRQHPAHWLGWKLLAVNLSDIAAMGVQPTGFLLSAALPADVPATWWAAFSQGLGELARREDVLIAGGDTVVTQGMMTLTITAWGVCDGDTLLCRSGARPGDLLMLCPGLGVGVSSEGLKRWITHELAAQWSVEEPIVDEVIVCHLRPEPPLWAGPWALHHGASAGMDCSDGLIQDVDRLAYASAVGFDVDLSRLPPDPRCGAMELIERAAGGEDYGLLVCIPAQKRSIFEARGFLYLGEAQQAQGVRWFDGAQRLKVTSEGFVHFERSDRD